MRKKFELKRSLLAYLLVVFLLLGGFMVAGCDGEEEVVSENGEEVVVDPSTEDPVDIPLEFATFWPAVDFQVDEGHKSWAAEIVRRVEAETPHTVEFKWHYGGFIGAGELWQNVVDGGIDIVTTCPNYTLGLFPATEAFELPGLNNDNALVSSMTMHEAWKRSEVLQNEYKDAKILHFWATGPGDFLTTAPVRKMEDFTGLTIRAVGGSIPWTIALGPSVVSYGMGDVLANFESGTIEGLLAPTDVLKGFNLAQYVTHVTKAPPAYNIIFMKAMNKNTWNALPPSVQQIFEEVSEEYVSVYGKLRTDHTVLGAQFGVEQGIEIIELEQDEWDRWEALYDGVLEEWKVKTNAMGLDAEAILELVSELDGRYSEEYGDYGN